MPIPHYIALNVWRPLPPSSPVTCSPLALCAAKSASNNDFVVKKIVLLNGQVGELWACKYNPQHQWCWISRQIADECWVFKLFDSEDAMGRVPHCAVRVPEQGDGEGDGRWSVEVRCVVFFGEVDLSVLKGMNRKEKDFAGEDMAKVEQPEDKDEELPTKDVEMEGEASEISKGQNGSTNSATIISEGCSCRPKLEAVVLNSPQLATDLETQADTEIDRT
jgi:hypothetical protein